MTTTKKLPSGFFRRYNPKAGRVVSVTLDGERVWVASFSRGVLVAEAAFAPKLGGNFVDAHARTMALYDTDLGPAFVSFDPAWPEGSWAFFTDRKAAHDAFQTTVADYERAATWKRIK